MHKSVNWHHRHICRRCYLKGRIEADRTQNNQRRNTSFQSNETIQNSRHRTGSGGDNWTTANSRTGILAEGKAALKKDLGLETSLSEKLAIKKFYDKFIFKEEPFDSISATPYCSKNLIQ